MTPRARKVSWIAVALVIVLATALLGGRSNDDAGPQGFLALKRTLTALGADVGDAERPPAPPSTYVLWHDLRDEAGAASLLQWVDAGGTLVVADPDSIVDEALGVAPVAPVGGGGTRTLSPSCATADTAGVRRLVVSSTDAVLASAVPHAVACFPSGEGAYAVEIRRGGGRAVLLGGSAPFRNRYLRRADDAVYAARLLGSGVVRFGPPVAPGQAAAEDGSAWDALPAAGRAVVVQIGVALLLFALARGRRIGRPRAEVPIAAIPAGELVHAEARLLRGAKARGFAAAAMRGFAQRRMATRARASARVEDAQPTTDDDLIAYGRRLEEIRRRLEDEEEA